MRLCVLCALTVVLSACRFGQAQFTSTLEGRTFDPTGTVFSYLDATDAAGATDDDPPVAIGMTWAVFDPASDLNDLDGAGLEELRHEIALRDAFSLVFAKQGKMKADAQFKAVIVGDNVDSDVGLVPTLHLAPERLTQDSNYADVVPFASKRTVDVTLTSVSFNEEPKEIAGDVTITFDRIDGDAGDAREGKIEGSFRAPLVGERVAESNLSLLAVPDVWGLPRQAAP